MYQIYKLLKSTEKLLVLKEAHDKKLGIGMIIDTSFNPDEFEISEWHLEKLNNLYSSICKPTI